MNSTSIFDHWWLCFSYTQLLLTEYEKSERMSKEYASTKGAGTSAKPHEHLFFRKLGPVLKRTLEKCVRENGFM